MRRARKEEIWVDAHAVRPRLPTAIFHATHQFHDFHVVFLPLSGDRH